MNRILILVRRLARPPILLGLVITLVLAMLSIHVVDTPWSLVRFRHVTGGLSILDQEMHYSGAQAYHRLAALGETGRHFYLWRLLAGLDVVIPLLIALTLSVAILLLLSGRGVSSDTQDRWALLPWLGAALDYGENVAIGVLLLAFPSPHQVLAGIAGWITTAKLTAYAASVLVVVALGVQRLAAESQRFGFARRK